MAKNQKKKNHKYKQLKKFLFLFQFYKNFVKCDDAC